MNKFITGAAAAAFALVLVATPAFADVSEDTVTLEADNYSMVTNEVESVALTGGNTANGAEASNKVDGGNVEESEYGNKAGNGGNEVLGGWGGIITTGDATANANVENTLNETDVEIDLAHTRRSHDENKSGDHNDSWNESKDNITVRISNNTDLQNRVRAFADTGANYASGEKASNELCGGNVKLAGSSNEAGNGSNKVEGGSGGEIQTGAAESNTSVVNVLNRTMTRVRR